MTTILLCACILLFGFAFAGLMLVRAQQQAEDTAMRVNAVLAPHRESWEDEPLAGGIGRAIQKANLSARIMMLLHYEPRRKVYYMLPLGAVIPMALITSGVFGYTGSTFLGLAGWLAAPPIFIMFCRAFFGWCENRTQQKLFVQFPDALATIVRAVRVGLPVVEALRVVAKESLEPTSREFNALVEQTAIGVPLDEALREMATLSGLPEYRFFATALSLQAQTGGGLTETLENLAETIRKRVAIRMRGHALAAEARMSSYILGALPIVTGGMLSVVNPNYVGMLFFDPTGRKLLFIGIGMLCVGAFTMHTMIRKSLS